MYIDAILKCKLLLISEVWHVSVLESADKQYLRIILNSHSHVAVECLFFEVGVRPLKYEIMRRRLMYLWKLLNVDKSELIHRIYKSQENASHPGDWVRLVEKDKQDLNLDILNSEIEELSKNKFKNIIDKKIESFALKQLNQQKDKHSKSGYLKSTSFLTSRYLVDSRFNKSENTEKATEDFI